MVEQFRRDIFQVRDLLAVDRLQPLFVDERTDRPVINDNQVVITLGGKERSQDVHIKKGRFLLDANSRLLLEKIRDGIGQVIGLDQQPEHGFTIGGVRRAGDRRCVLGVQA